MSDLYRLDEVEPPSDAEGPSPVAAAYRQFLREPRVEDDFLAAKALEHRVRAGATEPGRLTDAAAAAEVEAGRLARADDEDRRKHLAFGAGTALAIALAAADSVPAYLAAQAFGLDLYTTLGITAILVVTLAVAMWATAHYQSGWRRWLVIGALSAGLAAIGALRWWYLIVTAGDPTSAVLEASGLTIFTVLLVWLGVIVLGFTKARHVSAAEAHARALRREAQRSAARDAELRRRAGVAVRDLMVRAQVYSSRTLDDEVSRQAFLDHVRAELDR
jgi:hypothetical protein